MKPKVTIIIPSYNQEEYVEEAIISALEQSYKCEIILVDDGSPDASLKIARKYANDIKIITQTNRGLASARNTGIMNATGTHILPLDADDILMRTCVEELVEVVTKTNADVVAPSFRVFGLADQDIILMQNPTLNDFKIGNRLGYFSLIKKAALLEVGGYSTKMVQGYEDLHLWINLLTRNKRIITAQKPLVLYRTKQNSMYTEAKEKHHPELMEQIYKDFPQMRP